MEVLFNQAEMEKDFSSYNHLCYYIMRIQLQSIGVMDG